MRILVVEDDVFFADGLVSVLTRANHSVEHTGSGLHADRLLQQDAYDLVVLDIGLPDIDGFEVLRRMRARHSMASVMMLTARDAIDDHVQAVGLGVDDYLIKPVAVADFEAHVRALIPRNAPPDVPRSLVGLHVDVAAKRVTVDDEPVELTSREWALLEVFLRRPGRALSKDEIAESMLGLDDSLTANAIDVQVSRLRAKIEPAGVLIRTVRGFGYLWDDSDH